MLAIEEVKAGAKGSQSSKSKVAKKGTNPK
jgi:hypothetical protein